MKKGTKPTVVLTRKQSDLEYTIAMDAKGNLIAVEAGDEGEIAVSARDLDRLAPLAEALFALESAQAKIDAAESGIPEYTIGGHEVSYSEDACNIAIGCQNIPAKLVLRVHALSKARRSRKAAK